MKRFFVVVLLCVCTLQLVGCGIRQARQERLATSISDQSTSLPSTSAPFDGNVLFNDDFQDGQTDGWKVNSGWNITQNGDVYLFSVDGSGAAWLTSGMRWTDVVQHATVRLDSGTFSYNFRLTNQGRYILIYQQDGLTLAKEQPNENLTTLAQAAAPPLSTWHDLNIGCEGGHIQVNIDNILVIDYTDPSPLLEGTIGVGSTEGTRAYVDNISISALNGHLPTGTVALAPVQPAPNIPPLLAPPLNQIQAFDEEPQPIEPEPQQPIEAEAQQPPEQAQQPAPTASVDVVITDVTIPATVNRAEAVLVNVSVRNGGSQTSQAFSVVWLPNQNERIIGCSWDIVPLAARQVRVVSCTYPGYPNAGEFIWEVNADNENEVLETNERNNIVTRRIAVRGEDEPPDGGAPAAPDNCSSTPLNAVSVQVRWDYADNVEGFRIYQGVSSLETSANSGQRTVIINNLAPNTSYHFDVRALRNGQESPPDACAVDVLTPQ